MSNRDLLKEAIADAKAVKETAIANAKLALEEAFTPQLKSMLSAKLQEMEKEDMEEEIEEVVTTEAKEEIEEAKEKDMEEGYGKEDMDEELDLDEILAELEKDEEKEDMNEAEDLINDPKSTPTAHGNIAEEDEMEGEEDEEAEDDMEDEEIDLEEMSEEDLKSFIEDVIADMVSAGELEAGEEFEAEDDMEMDVDGEEELDIEDDAEEIMEGEKEEVNEEDLNESPFMDLAIQLRDSGLVDPENAMMAAKAIVGGGTAAIPVIGGIIAAMKDKKAAKSMGEGEEEDMMEEVNALRAELNEVNLLNAKLLYSNKIFRAQNLKEAQKVKVLEAFDKAANVSEVKLVFETLNQAKVKTTAKSTIKESLGSASRAAGVAPTVKSQIVEIDPQVARWQKLAGIK